MATVPNLRITGWARSVDKIWEFERNLKERTDLFAEVALNEGSIVPVSEIDYLSRQRQQQQWYGGSGGDVEEDEDGGGSLIRRGSAIDYGAQIAQLRARKRWQFTIYIKLAPKES